MLQTDRGKQDSQAPRGRARKAGLTGSLAGQVGEQDSGCMRGCRKLGSQVHYMGGGVNRLQGVGQGKQD